MAAYSYRIVNVFTRNGEALTGNPLCVFEQADALDTQTMQALARQFNLSETTFVLRSARADARVRIFTPSYEMPFAGHPTLGTAFVCHALGLGGSRLTLEMDAGLIPVTSNGARWTLQANPPTWREPQSSRSELAAMLNLDERDLGEHPLWVNAGKEQLIVPLISIDAVQRARPQANLCARDLSIDGHSMAYVFAPTEPGKLLSRFFFPVGGAMLEDPATGSATANLGGWFIATGTPLPRSYEISQGEFAQRPSTLYLDVDHEQRIFVGGEVIELGRGTVRL